MEAFQLRLWDGRIGRWLSVDPYGQYHSPYLGMGNNPVNGVDPDGGWFDPPTEAGTTVGEVCWDHDTGTSYEWDGFSWHSDMGAGVSLDELVITSTPTNASGFSDDSWWRIVPVFGSGLDSYDAFARGDWGMGILHAGLAISDVFLVKAVFTGIGKAVIKNGLKEGSKKYFGIGMSHSYGATVSRLKKVGHYTSNGTQFKHHWLISQELMKKYPSLLPLGNQTWNLTIFKSQASHMRWAHGQVYAGIGYSSNLTNSLYLVTSTPTWFKTGVVFGTKNLIND